MIRVELDMGPYGDEAFALDLDELSERASVAYELLGIGSLTLDDVTFECGVVR